MQAFWSSLAIVFLAELGDKTQLVALTLATRYNARTVLLGITAATLAVHLISVGLGGLVGNYLPMNWVKFVAGLAFIGFGIWTLRGDCLDDDEECRAKKVRSPFWLVATTFFLAELGDKTMLSTVALATSGQLVLVWLGSSIGMVISDGLAILVGQYLGKQLPERAIKIGASVIFFGFAAYSMFVGRHGIPAAAWIIGLSGMAVLAYTTLRPRRLPTAEVAGE